MKLPISLLVLAAWAQAASQGSTEKPVDSKESKVKQVEDEQNNKRDLYEGNFGDRELVSRFAASRVSPKIEYADDVKAALIEEQLKEPAPTTQVFGTRLPQIAKISDVLSGQGSQGSFEAAVANHLRYPISIYQARIAEPTTFEVPIAAASQLAYPTKKQYQSLSKLIEDEKKQPEPPKAITFPKENIRNIPIFNIKPSRLRFESYPNPLGPEFSRQSAIFSKETIRPHGTSGHGVPHLFPIINQQGPINMQYLQQHGIYQFIPANAGTGGIDYTNQEEDSNDQDNSNQVNLEESKSESTETQQLQSEIIVPQENYHAHPNGAISFVSFNLQDTPSPARSQQQSVQLQALQPGEMPRRRTMQTTEKTKLTTTKTTPAYTTMLSIPIINKYIQDLQKYQPGYMAQPQMVFKQPVGNNSPNTFNALQDLLLRNSLQNKAQLFEFPRLPAFKPLPELQRQPSTAYEAVPNYKQRPEPRPFGFHDQSTEHPGHIDQPIAPVAPQVHRTPLPPLKPNYNRHVRPLNPLTHISSIFLPTTLKPVPTTIPDQFVSSTTIQPDTNYKKSSKHVAASKTELQSHKSELHGPEKVHQSHVLSLSGQLITKKPVRAEDNKSEHSTPKPDYQSRTNPQGQDDVVIQRQELKELILKPYLLHSGTNAYQPHLQNRNNEQEAQELQALQHQQLLEQLQLPQFQNELQDMQSQQYQIETRHLKSQQEPTEQETNVPHKQDSQPLLNHMQPFQLQTPHQEQLENSEKQQKQKEEQPEIKFYLQHFVGPKTVTQGTNPRLPARDPETREDPTAQTEARPLIHYLLDLQPTTSRPNETPGKISVPYPNTKQSFSDAVQLPGHEVDLQLYAQPHVLISQPELDSLGTQSYPDIQFFGNFAQALLANLKQ